MEGVWENILFKFKYWDLVAVSAPPRLLCHYSQYQEI